MRFFFLKSTSGLSFDPLKKFGGSSSVGVSSVLSIFKPCDFDSSTFFQIEEPLGMVQIDITQSHMVDIIYIENFITN